MESFELDGAMAEKIQLVGLVSRLEVMGDQFLLES